MRSDRFNFRSIQEESRLRKVRESLHDQAYDDIRFDIDELLDLMEKISSNDLDETMRRITRIVIKLEKIIISDKSIPENISNDFKKALNEVKKDLRGAGLLGQPAESQGPKQPREPIKVPRVRKKKINSKKERYTEPSLTPIQDRPEVEKISDASINEEIKKDNDASLENLQEFIDRFSDPLDYSLILLKAYQQIIKNIVENISIENLPLVTELNDAILFQGYFPEHTDNHVDGYNYQHSNIMAKQISDLLPVDSLHSIVRLLFQNDMTETDKILFKEIRIFQLIQNEFDDEDDVLNFLYDRSAEKIREDFDDALESLGNYIDNSMDKFNVSDLIAHKQAIENEAAHVPLDELPHLTALMYRLLFIEKHPANPHNDLQNGTNVHHGLKSCDHISTFSWGKPIAATWKLAVGGLTVALLVTAAVVTLIGTLGAGAPFSAAFGVAAIAITASMGKIGAGIVMGGLIGLVTTGGLLATAVGVKKTWDTGKNSYLNHMSDKNKKVFGESTHTLFKLAVKSEKSASEPQQAPNVKLVRRGCIQ